MASKGMVYLVGAGPGDTGLLTLRGADLLKAADVVVYDGLVNPELLRIAPASAEIIYGGKHDRTRAVSQTDLNALLVAKAREGKRVVRLKGGDPYVFARGGEEAEMLAKAGIAFEVIPGVSSAEAVPNYAGIPLTHRNYCSSYTVVTGHEDLSQGDASVDWARIAGIQGTLVVLMGLKNIHQIAQALIANGRPPQTPVAMVSRGTTSRQRTIEGTLANIAGKADRADLKPPVVTVIGEVVKLRGKLNWFERLPLLGKRVVVTRARDQAWQLTAPLIERGAEVLEIPVIKTVPPKEFQPLVEAMIGLNTYDWLVFTSTNGVTAFFDYFFKAFQDMRDIGGVRIAAVGPGTAAKLKQLHLQVNVMPTEFAAAKIAGAMASFESLENLKILLLRAEVANPELPKLLEDKGAIVDDIACYSTVPETEGITGAASSLAQDGADWITFTSGSTVENFHAQFDLPRLARQFPKLNLATIGPETSKALAVLGLAPAVEAKPHTIEGLVAALERASIA